MIKHTINIELNSFRLDSKISGGGNAQSDDVLSGKTFTNNNGQQKGSMAVLVKSAFNQRSYENYFYANLDLTDIKTCFNAQGYSGDSEGAKQYVTPQYSIDNNTWINYTGGIISARYWRAQMVGRQHIGNFASVLVAIKELEK